MRKPPATFWLVLMLLPVTAHAYVGPGVGAGTVAVVLGILSSIFLAFVGIIWYPIKRLIKAFKGSKERPGESAAQNRDNTSQRDAPRS